MVGEDLGTVEAGVREALAERGMLSYRLLWFEDDAPAEWPAEALAAVTTHDLPTVAGLWTGADLAEQRGSAPVPTRSGARPHVAARPPPRACRTARRADEAVAAAHRRWPAPSLLLSATLDDAVGEERRPNMPGTIERPNWSLPLPVPIDDLPATRCSRRWRPRSGPRGDAGRLNPTPGRRGPGRPGSDTPPRPDVIKPLFESPCDTSAVAGGMLPGGGALPRRAGGQPPASRSPSLGRAPGPGRSPEPTPGRLSGGRGRRHGAALLGRNPPGSPGIWPGLLVEWRQRDGGWQGRVAYTVAGPTAPHWSRRGFPAARLEPR